MPDFALQDLSRDSFIVEFEGVRYKVDGERGTRSWDVYPKMVYRFETDGSRHRVEDDALRRRIVAALTAHCQASDFAWKLNVVDD